jgi:hypothetical protein
MLAGWFARLFFAVVAVLAVAGIVSGTACTRWGQPGPISPTLAPLSALFVNAETGSDTTGNGSVGSPYKTLTKAVAVLDAAKSLSPSGVTIGMSSGDYDAANGEIFPIVVSKSVSIGGSSFGGGPRGGSFINGVGEDTLFEHLVRAPAHTTYTTIEFAPGVTGNLNNVYVGASKLSLPGSSAAYFAIDDLGALTASVSSIGAGIVSALRNVSGILVPGGTLTCSSCQIHGNDFGIAAFAVPVSTASPPSGTGPSITLNHTNGDSTITSKVVGIVTDGSPDIVVSNESFLRSEYAFADSFPRLVFTPTRGAVDFGGGVTGSPGGNVFLGAKRSEISIVRRNETVSALDDTWNPNQQRANGGGRYTRNHTFKEGASGKNVTILHDAVGSTVEVGPAPAPTPSPSFTPSTTPSATPTP